MEVVFLIGWLFFVPLSIGIGAVLLASSKGAKADVRLPGRRHYLATATGAALGIVGFVFVIAFGVICMVLRERVEADGYSAGYLVYVLSILIATVVAAVIAYQTAHWVAARLNGYKCIDCYDKFHSNVSSIRCPVCGENYRKQQEERDHITARKAIDGFVKRFTTVEGDKQVPS